MVENACNFKIVLAKDLAGILKLDLTLRALLELKKRRNFTE